MHVGGAGRAGGVEGADEGQAVGEALGGVLGQGAGDDRPFGFRQRPQFRRIVQVLLGQLAGVFAVERPLAGEQFLVDDGQAVLVAVVADAAAKGFRRGVQRRDAAQDARRGGALQVLDQAEIADLDAVADEEQVARLDVEVLEAVLVVHVVEAFGRVPDVAQQRVARDADQAGRQAVLEGIVQTAIRPLHDDDEFAGDFLDAVHRQNERVAHLLDAVKGLLFLFGAGAVHVEGVEVAEDELDGFEEAAGRLALPDLAEAAAAERLDQAVAGNRFRIWLPQKTHGSALFTSGGAAEAGRPSRR